MYSHIKFKCIYMESTTSMLKGGERDGGQTGIGGPSLPFIEGGVGCWSPFVEGDDR